MTRLSDEGLSSDELDNLCWSLVHDRNTLDPEGREDEIRKQNRHAREQGVTNKSADEWVAYYHGHAESIDDIWSMLEAFGIDVEGRADRYAATVGIPEDDYKRTDRDGGDV